MGRKRGISALVVVWAYMLLHADIVFEDPFDVKDNWVKANAGTCTESLGNGLFTINATSFSAYKHSQALTDFTYSMKIRFESSLDHPVGIIFCLQDNFNNYMFSLSKNGQYNFGIFKGGSYTNDTSNFHSFIDFSPNAFNTLKVSKKDGEISLFCNNTFLQKITDTQFSSGDIGFAVDEKEKASFDHALVIDTAEVGAPRTWFLDDFEDSDLRGWRYVGGGTATSENGVMKVPAGSADLTSRIYTNGNYRDMPCTTVVEHKGGGGFYGIGFMTIQPGQNITGYYYYINSSRQYSVFSTSGTIHSNSNIHGTKDTLIVTKDYKFIVNGHILDDSTFDSGQDFNAVGLCVYPGVSVEFDNFRAGISDGTPIIYEPDIVPLYSKVKQSYLLGGSGIIFDIRGRKVTTFQSGYKDKLKSLSSGSYYIVIPDGKKNHIIRQAIITSK